MASIVRYETDGAGVTWAIYSDGSRILSPMIGGGSNQTPAPNMTWEEYMNVMFADAKAKGDLIDEINRERGVNGPGLFGLGLGTSLGDWKGKICETLKKWGVVPRSWNCSLVAWGAILALLLVLLAFLNRK